MRVVAIDYGRVRIGLALTDVSKTIAYPYKTVLAGKDFEKTSQNILDSLKEYLSEIETFVIGLPISLKGEASKMSKEVEEFAKIFQTKTKIPIKFIDERLSSKMAERHLKDTMKMNRKKRSKIVDPIAATLLLQNFIRNF